MVGFGLVLAFTCWLPSVRVVEFVIWVVMFCMLYCLALVNSVVHIVLIVFVIVWGGLVVQCSLLCLRLLLVSCVWCCLFNGLTCFGLCWISFV